MVLDGNQHWCPGPHLSSPLASDTTSDTLEALLSASRMTWACRITLLFESRCSLWECKKACVHIGTL